jgi:DNA-binding beta-propeller fold protein YncE
LYIGVDSDSGVLKALDCTADTLLPDVRIALTNTGPLALSTVSHKLYCAGTLEDSWGGIVAVSTDSLVLVDTVTQSGIPDTMVYSPLTDWLYCPLDESVLIVDCQSDTIRSQLEAPYVTALTVSALDGKAYIALEESSRLMVLDTLDSVVGWIQTPNVPFQYTSALAFRPGRNELYGVTTASRVFVVDASADTVSGVLDYATYLPRQMVHNPAGNKLYLLCTAQDAILIVDSTFGAPKQRPGAVINSDAVPVLNHSLNRLYVADDDELRVIDCNTDSLIGIHEMYGINGAVPVMVPYLNRLYVFSSSAGTGGDSAYVYDCLRDTVSSIFLVSDDVPSAVYDSRSNRVFFACADAPTVRALDPVTNSVVKTFDLVGGSYGGMMTLNTDLGRLYYVDQSPDMLFTIDVSTDSVISSESLHWNIDATFLNRRLGKLYMCGSAQTLVFDCALGAIVDTIDAGFTYSGLMDDRNDKLYLEYGAVVDCRYDSVVTQLDSINSRSTAWDAIDNRVFKATTSRLYVYRDDPYGMEEQKGEALGPMLAVLGNPARASLRLRLQIPHGQTAILALHDVAGRLVRSLSVTRTATLNLDLKSMPAGVYLVSLEVNGNRRTDKVIVQH